MMFATAPKMQAAAAAPIIVNVATMPPTLNAKVSFGCDTP
jgi:hypothetical protein